MKKLLLSVFFLNTSLAFATVPAEDPSDKEVYNGLIFRDSPQVVAGANQNINILPHLDTLRKVDRVDEKDGWVKVRLYYNKSDGQLSEPVYSWIWHANYAQYVEPYFAKGTVTNVSALKQKTPPDPKTMHTYSVSLSDDFQSAGIPTRDAEGKKIPYWAPAASDASPLRLIYTVPDMKPRWVPREHVESYHHVTRSKVQFADPQGNVVFNKGDHLVELSFDGHLARVYNLNDPDRVVYNVPVAQLRSLDNMVPLKIDISELESDEVAKTLEKTDGLVGEIPAGKKQAFLNSKGKEQNYNGPLKLIKVEDGKGKFSWATRVQVIDSKGKSLGNWYISEKMFNKYKKKGFAPSNTEAKDVAEESENLRENRQEVPESDLVKGPDEGGTTKHLGELLGHAPTKSNIPVKYERNEKFCGERAGQYAKYYYEEPKLSQRSDQYKNDFVSAANETGVAPGLLAAMVHIESKFNPRLENTKEKNSVGGNESHKSNPSIWGKGIAQLGRSEGKILGLDWYGSYKSNHSKSGSVWHPGSAIEGMADLLLIKVKEINIIEKKHNELVAQGKRKHKIEPPGSLAKFMLDRESFQPAPALKADGSNAKEIELYHQVAYAEKMRYLTSMYNRGMRAPNAIIAYLERTGSFPGYYGQAWSEPPHETQSNDDVLYIQQINRGHIYRTAGLCGALPSASVVSKYGADFSYNGVNKTWSLK